MESVIPDDAVLVVWASRVLVAAAAIFFYDFLLTFSSEMELYEHMTRRTRSLLMFLPLRYIPALYQLVMVLAIIDNTWTSSRCSKWDTAALVLDTLFQISYISVISWRVKTIVGTPIAIPIAILGFISPVINVAVSNPSIYAQCRLLSTSPTAE
ncbi:hypothetical protein C8R44DRAFT_806690 [Mycena epipterygia]|nr:hypothetical protein C8R44DRAFT_806690 [Mycena epipterygia]